MPKEDKKPTGEAHIKKAVEDALALVKKAGEIMKAAGLYALTDEERLHSNGRLRKGEPAAMRSVCDAMDASPGAFEALAPHDHGKDASVVETAPTREAIDRYEIVAPLVAEVDELSRSVGDDALSAASLAKEVTVPAYAILRANAPINKKLATAGKKALDFYGGFGLRRAKKNKRAQKNALRIAKTGSPK